MPKQRDGDRDLLTRIAWMYYYADMNQQMIAKQLDINRVKVTRLLKRVRDEGIVRVEIQGDHVGLYPLEEELRRVTGLQQVVVVPETDRCHDSVCHGIGHLFNELLSPVGRLGMGLSRTLFNLSKYLDPERCGISSVTSISGTATPSLALTPANAGLAVAQALAVDFFAIWSPVIVSPSTDARTVLSDKFIATALDMAADVDWALVGIGNVNDSQLMQMGYISEEELTDIKSRGVVGEISGNYFTTKGTTTATSIDHRIIAVDFPMRCPVIGAACGADKVEPIVGAIRAGYIQGVVTDEPTAKAVVTLMKE
ncbi:MAG: hypothetical protein MI724_04350 [Spirochaetales bacterium]|nr:hypothetical protein [Spirochaetales bacterium]